VSKQSGIGDRLFVAGYDASGDVGAISKIGLSSEAIDVTAISSGGRERIYGLADGEISFTGFWRDDPGAVFEALKNPRTPEDRIVTYLRGQGLGNHAAAMVARQVNFDWSREAAGGLTFTVQCLSGRNGLDWCTQLTPGIRTDANATAGASVDNGAGTSTGWAAYLQVISLTSGNPTVLIEESQDDGAGDPWATLASFGSLTAPGAYVAKSASKTAAVERYLRVRTTGTFSQLKFVVVLTREPLEV
jgi:hypothetical protein